MYTIYLVHSILRFRTPKQRPYKGFGWTVKQCYLCQGTKISKCREQGTKAILGKREHRKIKILILKNKGKCWFISGEQGNRYPPPAPPPPHTHPWKGLKQSQEMSSSKYFISGQDNGSLLYEIRTLQTSMQQLYGGIEAFKTEIIQYYHNSSSELATSISSVSSDVKSLALIVDSLQSQLSKVDDTVTNLTKTVHEIDVEIIDTTEQPSTPMITTTPAVNFTSRSSKTDIFVSTSVRKTVFTWHHQNMPM